MSHTVGAVADVSVGAGANAAAVSQFRLFRFRLVFWTFSSSLSWQQIAMSNCKAKMHQIQFRLGLRPSPK